MKLSISVRFTDSMLIDVARRYGINKNTLNLLGGFDSLVYEFSRQDGNFILRILQDPRRTLAIVQGELDWIEHLVRNGVPAARPIYSMDGNLVETIIDDQGGLFLCTAFERAPGGEIRMTHIGDRLFESYGDLIGRMHAATKSYLPGNSCWKRPDWDTPGAISADIEMPPGQDEVMNLYRKVKNTLRALPRDPECYGLIHTDAHFSNICIDEDFNLTIFDFAECCYGHFIYDIAMVLFYFAGGFDDSTAFTGKFLPPFLTAYRKHNRINPSFLQTIPLFLSLREIDLYAEFLSYQKAGSDDQGGEWRDEFLMGRKEKILSGTSYIEFDWSSLAGYL